MIDDKKLPDRYSLRGVSSTKEEVHSAISNLDKGLFPNSFCKIVPDYLCGDPNYCIAKHADGAGTKSALAYAYWRETGDLSVWAGIAQDAIVMNIDDLLCAGICSPILLSSIIGRNKQLIPGRVLSALIQGTQTFVQQLAPYGIEIHLTGGETADVGDLVRTVIVDSTVTARIQRDQVISNDKIKSGDVVVGLASSGKAVYENEYNSGIGSNGLTSARHDLFGPDLTQKYPETYSEFTPKELIYSGNLRLTNIEPTTGITFGKLALSPTRTYAPVVFEVLSKFRKEIHGMVHCSGGGQTKVLHFINQMRVIKDQMFPIPPIFKIIQQESQTTWHQMYSVFNMGHRMELYVSEEVAADTISISQKYGVDAKVIGRVEAAQVTEVIIETPNGKYTYVK